MVYILAALWFVALVMFVAMWLMQRHVAELEFVLPLILLTLSFVVFREAPALLRRIHHVVVGPALVAAVAGSALLVLFGREQSAVGGILLVYLIGLGYVPFILLLALAAAASAGRSGQ